MKEYDISTYGNFDQLIYLKTNFPIGNDLFSLIQQCEGVDIISSAFHKKYEIELLVGPTIYFKSEDVIKRLSSILDEYIGKGEKLVDSEYLSKNGFEFDYLLITQELKLDETRFLSIYFSEIRCVVSLCQNTDEGEKHVNIHDDEFDGLLTISKLEKIINAFKNEKFK